MVRVLESLSALNSFIRTLLAAGALGLVSMGGWFGYRTMQADALALRQSQQELVDLQGRTDELADRLAVREADLRDARDAIGKLQTTVAERDEQIDRLDTAMRLLTVDRRLARLSVVGQTTASDGTLHTDVAFVELDDRGDPLEAPRSFRVQGDLVFIHCWVVKFEDAYVGASDPLRSTSLVIFRRLFGAHQAPHEGFVLDAVGSRPLGYGRSADVSEFEQTIWDSFWSLANDPEEAGRYGVRAAHGEAPSIKVEPGQTYMLQLRASDGLSIIPERPRPVPQNPPA